MHIEPAADRRRYRSGLPGRLASLKEWLVQHHMTLVTMADTPHSIALGSAIGIFFGFTPLWGLKTLLSIAVAWVCRCNKIAAVIAVTVHDIYLPLMPAIYYWQYRVGARFLHGYEHRRSAFEHWGLWSFFHWSTFSTLGWPMLVGSLFVATPIAVAVYFVMRLLVSRARTPEWQDSHALSPGTPDRPRR